MDKDATARRIAKMRLEDAASRAIAAAESLQALARIIADPSLRPDLRLREPIDTLTQVVAVYHREVVHATSVADSAWRVLVAPAEDPADYTPTEPDEPTAEQQPSKRRAPIQLTTDAISSPPAKKNKQNQ